MKVNSMKRLGSPKFILILCGVCVLALVGWKGVSVLIDMFIVDHTPPTVAVVTFQKNEVRMLDFWISYHAALFGVANIAILDNGSDLKESIDILTKWESQGVLVVYDQAPYLYKGNLSTDAFLNYFADRQVAIPLDIDEILVSYRDDLPVINRTTILSDVNTFWRSGAPCGAFAQYFTNQIDSPTSTVESSTKFLNDTYGQRMAKKYVRLKKLKGHLKGFDFGNHDVKMKPVPGIRGLNHRHCYYDLNHLGLLHYTEAEPIAMLREGIQDSIGLGWFPANMTAENLHLFKKEIDAARNKPGIAGSHKVERVIFGFDWGVERLFRPAQRPTVTVGNFSTLLHQIANS